MFYCARKKKNSSMAQSHEQLLQSVIPLMNATRLCFHSNEDKINEIQWNFCQSCINSWREQHERSSTKVNPNPLVPLFLYPLKSSRCIAKPLYGGRNKIITKEPMHNADKFDSNLIILVFLQVKRKKHSPCETNISENPSYHKKIWVIEFQSQLMHCWVNCT